MAMVLSLLFVFLAGYLTQVTASTKDFVPQNFWRQISTNCSTALNDLGACLSPDSKVSVRNEAADRYTECFFTVYDDYFECAEVEAIRPQKSLWQEIAAELNAHNPLPPLNLNLSTTCSYPEPESILQGACNYDIEEIPRSNCCANEKGEKSPCLQLSTNFIYCHQAAIQQYVRCTGRDKPSDNITDCVSISERVTWLPAEFLIYSGATECPNTKKTLTVLALANAFSLLCAILSKGGPLLWKRFRKGPMEKPADMKLGFISIFWTLLLDLSKPIILGLLSQRAGYRVDVLMAIFLWAVRPRSAALIGLLGLFHPSFMENALSKLVSDLVFSVAAGSFAFLVAIFPNRTHNPHKPEIFRTYRVGGILMLIPAVIIWLAMFMAAIDHCKLITVIKYPCREGYTKLRNLRKKKGEKIPEKRVEFEKFKAWYYNFLFLSIILFIGSWMVWATFLTMASDLYCPASLREVAIILFTFPILENVVKLLVG